MNLTSNALCLATTLVLASSCDPTATRLTPKKLEFLYAANMRSFDHQGNLLLSGFNAPYVVRMNREKQEFQDFSQGLDAGRGPTGEIHADTNGNLAAGGWYRGVSDAQWVSLPSAPIGTRPGPWLGLPRTPIIFTLDAAGTVYAVIQDLSDSGELFELYRMQPPSGAWEKLVGGLERPQLEPSAFRARPDGTVFIGNKVWVKGASEVKALLKCPTLRIDQACERGFQVFTHVRRNETFLVARPSPGLTVGKLFRLPADAVFPVDYDSLKDVEIKGSWRPVRVSSDGVLHVASVQSVMLETAPYEADEATLYAVDGSGARAEARLIWNDNLPVVGDHRDIYQASAQLVAGGIWVPDPVYVWNF